MSVSWADPILVGSAWDVAVIVTLVGRPAATTGGVYVAVVGPVDAIVPPFAVVTAHVTAVLVLLVTVAVNDAV